MINRKTRSVILSLIAFQIVFFACTNNKSIEFITEPSITNNPNKTVSLASYIDFETTIEYDSVFFTLDDGSRISQLKYSKNEKSSYGYLLLFMRADQNIHISMRLKDQKGRIHSTDKKLSFTSPKLPSNDKEFPKIDITKNQKEGDEELILFNPRRRLPLSQAGANKFNQAFGMLIIINQQGDVLWYYKTDSRISDFDMLPNGNISYMTQNNCVYEIDLAGNTINVWYAANRPNGKKEEAIPVDALTFHHDVCLLENGNRLVLNTEIREIDNYYTTEWHKNAQRKKQNVVGDVVIEFTPEGKVVHRWSAFDKMPVMRIGYDTFNNYWGLRGFPNTVDWSHANAIVGIKNEDSYLVNFRHQSAIIKVNKNNGEIEWIFAEPSGWGEELQDKLLTIEGEGLNWHQHSPRFTKNGNLLFFNNNNYQTHPFEEPKPISECPSYIVEYKINEQQKTAMMAWSTEHCVEEKVYSVAMGRVSEIESSGNILACFGALLKPEYFDQMTWENRGKFPQWTMVREYTHTDNPQVVWEMQLHPLTKESKVGWTLFGAERIEIN